MIATTARDVRSEAFDLAKFVGAFPVLADALGGTGNLRRLTLQLALQGRFTGAKALVPAVVRGNHEAIGKSKGRGATTMTIAGASALAVGTADMRIPAGWDWVPLVAVARLESGHTPSRNRPDYWGGGIPWIGIKDARQHNCGWIETTEQTVSEKGLANSSARLLPRGTVCLSRTASVGYVTIMKRPMATSQDFVNWVCGERLLPEYLMQLLRSEVPMLKRFSKGAVHQTIYFPEVKAFHISLPPLAEQKRIVERVDQLMALIDELEAKQTRKRDLSTRFTKASLDALTNAQSPEEFDAAWTRVIENWDVVLDRSEKVAELRRVILGAACQGRLTDRGSGSAQDALAQTKARVTMLASQSGDVERREAERHIAKLTEQNTPPPAGALPAGWAWATLLAASTHLVDCHNKTAPYTATGVVLLRTTNIRDGRIVLEGAKYVSEATYAHWSKRCPPTPGDVIITREAPMGEVGLIEPGMRVCMGQRQMLLRVLRTCILPEYLLIALREPTFQQRMTRSAVGSTVKHLRVGDVESLFIALPPLEEQKRIVAKVEQLMKVCDELEAKLRRAEDRAAKLVEAVVLAMAG